ncbi:MAG: hypothetical protein ACI837_001172 [Crocinitomicaceae bacterium]|jgi:hypothetical protein
MKQILLSTLFIFTLSLVQGKGLDQITIPCWLDSSVVDTSLSASQATYEFRFHNAATDGKQEVIYSIDGITYRGTLDGNALMVLTSPGKHKFQFYYSESYDEVYTDSLEIREGYRDIYSINLTYAFYGTDMDKPVIYLYPEKETSVTVTMDIKGETLFTYPVLEDDTWQFTASPNGDLQFADRTYNYLFWESLQNRYLNHAEMKEGFNVKAENVVSFLEDKLTAAGLNSQEKADFITYWGPRLSAHAFTFVRFEFNEECNRYAEMSITPKPDNVNRIYMAWTPIEEPLMLEAQKIEKMNRTGFTIVEWGGFETEILSTTKRHIEIQSDN